MKTSAVTSQTSTIASGDIFDCMTISAYSFFLYFHFLIPKINQEKPESISQITQLSFISRYLERAADHTTNIAEHVFYMAKGNDTI